MLDKESYFIKYLEDQVTSYIFSVCGRSIFEQHKLVFSFFIASKIGLREKSITWDEYWYFLTGTKVGFETSESSTIEWINDKQYNQLITLANVSEVFKNLIQDIKSDEQTFKRLIHSETIHDDHFPAVFAHIDNFKKGLFVKAVKPEKIMFMMKK
mmetsp:Transcript_6889/g.6077  ORF Transcript_6889/g.6077 Transcript_6889/m.6077 type:complete len:155 (+) Transcript_6889:800-1264(+)